MHINFFSLLALLLAFILTGIDSNAEEKKSTELHNVIGCRIIGMGGEAIRRFPGYSCVLYPDGSLAASTENYVSFYDGKMNPIWIHALHAHHSLNKTSDNNSLLVMDSIPRVYKGQIVRFDRLLLLNLKGETVSSFDFFDRKDEIIMLAHQNKNIALKKSKVPFLNVTEFEFSHVNSFYEIPENGAAKKNPAFQKGNFIVNVPLLNLIVVLDRTLKTILWSWSYKKSVGWFFHDAQVNSGGKILLYNNFRSKDTSSIDELDPFSGKIKIIYSSKEAKKKFFSDHMGGAQILMNGNYLISDFTNGGEAYELDKNMKIVWHYSNSETDPLSGLPKVFQDFKRYDLSEFLKNNNLL